MCFASLTAARKVLECFFVVVVFAFESSSAAISKERQLYLQTMKTSLGLVIAELNSPKQFRGSRLWH